MVISTEHTCFKVCIIYGWYHLLINILINIIRIEYLLESRQNIYIDRFICVHIAM